MPSTDRLAERIFHRAFAFADGVLGTMEVEHPDVGEPRSDEQVRRLTGHAAAHDAHLHDVEAGCDHVRTVTKAGIGGLGP